MNAKESNGATARAGAVRRGMHPLVATSTTSALAVTSALTRERAWT